MRTNAAMNGIREIGCLLLVASVLVGCRTQIGQRSKGKQVLSASARKALAEFNRGAALLEQYKYAEAARAFEAALELAPDWTAARFNLGLAYFNMQKGRDAIGHLENAQKAFEDVLQSEPNHLHARFCLGLYYQHFGEAEKALECFEAVHRADSADTHAAYKYAEALLSLDRNEEGTRILEKIIARDPGFISAVYRLASQYQRAKQRDKARGLFARFKQLKEAGLTGGSFAVLKTYGTVGKYYLALGAGNLALPRFETAPSARILFSPEIRHIDAEVSGWKCAAGDVDGDGDIDLCIAGLDANGSTSL